jgi:hypothetical protein
MRIPTLLQKISNLVEHTERPGVIEVDLMLDYTRVLYADLLEWRAKIAGTANQPAAAPQQATPPKPAAPARPAPNPVAAPTKAAAPPATPPPAATIPPVQEPTLAELAAAMDKQLAEDDEEKVVPVKPQPKAPPPHHIPRPTATKPAILPDPDNGPAKPAAPVTPPPQVKPVVQADATALSSRTAGTKPAPPVQDVKAGKDIRSLISINEKYQIMSELFSNDKEAYEAALNHINGAGSEAAAIKWLQDTLWVTEERGDAVQNFYDLVNRFYR